MSKKGKVIVIDPNDLVTLDPAKWCESGDGYFRCRICGSTIRVGGTMIRDGKTYRRAWCPFKWYEEHSRCRTTSEG